MQPDIRDFIERMNKIGIKVELTAYYPWVYIYSINGIRVKEIRYSESYYTLCFSPIKIGERANFIDIRELFKVIRKYVKLSKRINKQSN